MEIIGLLRRQGEGSYITELNIGPFINTIAPLFVQNETMESDLLEFRKLIEIEAVRLAAKKQVLDTQVKDKKSRLNIAFLEKQLSIMYEALNKNDINLGAEADIQFHKVIFKLTDNIILIKASECIAYILESSVKFNRTKILTDSNNTKELYSQHYQIYEAIKLGNSELAAQIMEKHLNFVNEISD